MIWLTWRQFRAQAWAALAVLAVIGIAFAVTGPHLNSLYDTSGIATCQAHGDCGTAVSSFLDQVKGIDTVLYFLGLGVLYLAPGIIGLFWGGAAGYPGTGGRHLPDDLEPERHPDPLDRRQARPDRPGQHGRRRVAQPHDVVVGQPHQPGQGLNASRNGSSSLNRLTPLLFGASGIAPVGYAAFAFILGVTAGVLIRRTVPAMAVTLALFAAIQVIMPNVVRPHLIAPLRSVEALNAAAIYELSVGPGQMKVTGAVNIPGAWILSNRAIDAAGHPFTGPPTPACLNGTGGPLACNASIGKLHLLQLVIYQPASRYWAFQWYETALYLAAALALAGFCVWWIRRRLS